jgi:transcription antitermination protein NusB
VTESSFRLGGRRESREEALAFLYETELIGSSVADTLDGRDLPPEDYALAMVEGIAAERDELDEIISRNLKGWRLARMAIVDRTIARMATWELKSRPDVPTGVVLSEAVELATQYCGEDSPRFLNGVLSAVAVELRPDGG